MRRNWWNINFVLLISYKTKLNMAMNSLNLLGVDIKHRYLINSNCMYDLDSYFTALFINKIYYCTSSHPWNHLVCVLTYPLYRMEKQKFEGATKLYFSANLVELLCFLTSIGWLWTDITFFLGKLVRILIATRYAAIGMSIR